MNDAPLSVFMRRLHVMPCPPVAGSNQKLATHAGVACCAYAACVALAMSRLYSMLSSCCH
jgi:hypothetical protein